MSQAARQAVRDEGAAIRPDAAETPDGHAPIHLLNHTIISSTGNKAHNHATLNLEIDGKRRTFAQSGNGPIDAVCKALHDVGTVFRLKHYRTHSLTEGSDATGEANVTIVVNDREYAGMARDENLDAAGARAIIDALNKARTNKR